MLLAFVVVIVLLTSMETEYVMTKKYLDVLKKELVTMILKQPKTTVLVNFLIYSSIVMETV